MQLALTADTTIKRLILGLLIHSDRTFATKLLEIGHVLGVDNGPVGRQHFTTRVFCHSAITHSWVDHNSEKICVNFRKSLTEIPRNGCGTMWAAAVTWKYPISPDGRLAELACTGSR